MIKYYHCYYQRVLMCKHNRVNSSAYMLCSCFHPTERTQRQALV